ncbi:hypothetical protein GCM10025879_17250 [Leuconostoc litchii]|nr:SAM-dependent methyltransferase [Leuconostoc litchii]GMA70479.1 hypothetical protein GCM10025879_17250 [Leuconostoc litchii]
MKTELEKYIKIFANEPNILSKIQAAHSALQALDRHDIPGFPLPKLSFTNNEILSDLRLMALDDLFSEFRQTIIEYFGVWHLPNKLWLNDLHQFIAGRAVIEIMAGNGVITSQLRNFHDHIIATDTFNWQDQDTNHINPWTAVDELDALTAIQTLNYDVIILSWAPDTDIVDWQILLTLRKNHFKGDFVVIGEKDGATNSSVFWKNANLSLIPKLNRYHQPFDFINDQVWLVQ